MGKGKLLRAATLMVGLALVRVLDEIFPWSLPNGMPEWVIVSVTVAKYGSGIWLTHSVVRRFLSTVTGK